MVDGIQGFLPRVPVAVESMVARDWAGTPLEDNSNERTVA
jgi:hypothetical protein